MVSHGKNKPFRERERERQREVGGFCRARERQFWKESERINKTKPRAACFSASPPDFVPTAIRSNLSGATKRCHSLYEKASLTVLKIIKNNAAPIEI